MNRSLLLHSLVLVACSGKSTETLDDTAQLERALPEVWGPAGLEDHDPAADVVEVHLEAGLSDMLWSGADDETEVWAYNGQVPGPLIQLWEGQTLRVVLDNQLEDSETTIHWHGLRIDDAMDGVPAVQDPVAPGEQFTYEFTPPDTGSFWYHPHVRSFEQVERGLQGALIVHEADAPEVSRDRMFVLDDAYLRSSGDFYSFELGHMEQMHGRQGNLLMANGQAVTGDLGEPLADDVESGTSERWRVVNTANARTMYVDVTGARWRVVAVDGTLLPEPYEAERVLLPVGRRFDLEVTPDTAESDTVGLRVLLDDGSGGYSEYPVFEGAVVGSEPAGDWLSWPADALPSTTTDVEQEIDLSFDGQSTFSGDVEWTINDSVYGEHEDISVDGNTPSTLRITDDSGAEHPFHLHGQFFQVLEVDGEAPGPEYSGLLDTVLLDGDGDMLLYSDFDNPGRWLAHCHILEHAELGMMTEMVVE